MPANIHMPTPVRAFIAIKIRPTKPLQAMLNQIGQLGRAVRTVKPDNLHITLQFLGLIEHVAIPAITESIRHAVSSVKLGPFNLFLRGLGAFPNTRRPAVIWAGCPNPGPLSKLVALLQQPPADKGLFNPTTTTAPTTMLWHVHLTLARVNLRHPDRAQTLRMVTDLLQQFHHADFATQRIKSIDLLASNLRPTGPQYHLLSSVPLKPNQPSLS